MNLTLSRTFKGQHYTIGKLFIDSIYFCDTLEDTVRGLPPQCPDTARNQSCACHEKVYSQTAIPAGTYRVTLEQSPRFKRVLPYLHDVPHFMGVLIHSGNTAKDSAGCILVGRNKVKGQVLDSRVTLDLLMRQLTGQEDITIKIV